MNFVMAVFCCPCLIFRGRKQHFIHEEEDDHRYPLSAEPNLLRLRQLQSAAYPKPPHRVCILSFLSSFYQVRQTMSKRFSRALMQFFSQNKRSVRQSRRSSLCFLCLLKGSQLTCRCRSDVGWSQSSFHCKLCRYRS